MGFIPAKCQKCGYNMQLDESLEKGYCPACGTPYVKEEIINNFNTYNTTNYRIEHADAVNYYGSNQSNNSDFVIRGGVLERYTGASTDVVIPDGVVEIKGFRATDIFHDKYDIYSSTLRTTIHHMFANSRIKSVIIPDSVKILGSIAFMKCEELTNVSMSKNISTIGLGAFGGCKSLVKIIIPASVESLGQYVFGDCTSLSDVTFLGENTHFSENVFYNCPNLKMIKTPRGVIYL